MWVKTHPRLAAEAKSFADADAALRGAIIDATGDGENVREYDPPAPSSLAQGEGVAATMVFVSGNSWAMVANPDDIFDGGVCPECQNARGHRTAKAAVLENIEAGYDGGLARIVRKPLGSGPMLSFFSAEFLKALKPRERMQFEWRLCSRKGRGRKQFYELVAAPRVIPLAAIKPEFAPKRLWRCPVCGAENDPIYSMPGLPSWFVSAADVPQGATCIAIGSLRGTKIGFSRNRWQNLLTQPGTKGIRSYDVGILETQLVDRRPPRDIRGADN